MRRVFAPAAVLAGLIAAACAEAAGPADPAGACETLATSDFSRVPDAPTRVAVARAESGFCHVVGYVVPRVGFELRLPDSAWNGKLYHAGCGGLCGDTALMLPHPYPGAEPLARGYAVLTSDMGHRGSSPSDGMWARGDPQARIDFAFRATHVVTLAARAILERYYGTQAQRAYFEGCSTGGRQALMLAQRYPADYDGIIAGCPVLNPSTETLHVAWSVRATLDARGQPILTGEQFELVHEAVLAACDARDGVMDGILADPAACNFNPVNARCKGRSTADCLTPAQAEVVRKLYQGARNSRGDALYPGGAVAGSEEFWGEAFIGAGGRPSFEEELADSFLANLAFDD